MIPQSTLVQCSNEKLPGWVRILDSQDRVLQKLLAEAHPGFLVDILVSLYVCPFVDTHVAVELKVSNNSYIKNTEQLKLHRVCAGDIRIKCSLRWSQGWEKQKYGKGLILSPSASFTMLH